MEKLTFEDIKPFLHLPQDDAAKELSCSDTFLKQQCRKMGISRWPYRQVRSLSNMIAVLYYLLSSNKIDYMNRKMFLFKLYEILPLYREVMETGKISDVSLSVIVKPYLKLVKKHLNTEEFKSFKENKNIPYLFEFEKRDIRMSLDYILN